MKVQFINAWNGYDEGAVYSVTDVEARRLIALGIARAWDDEIDNPGPVVATLTARRRLVGAAASYSAVPQRVMAAGASQYSRCSTEVQVATAQVRNQVLYITHAAPLLFGFVSGYEAFCAVPDHFVFGNVTITSDTTLTMPAPGMADTVTNTEGNRFLHFTGLHAGASWLGHLQSRYGGGMKFVGNVSQHGANVQEVVARMPEVLRAIALKQPDIIIYEPGWGNSFNQDREWSDVMPQAKENLRQICAVVPTVVLATLPPIAPGVTSSDVAVDNFFRLNDWLLSGDFAEEFPNVMVVDSTTALIDKSRTDAGSIAGVHSDTLHWTPKGAYMLANSCYGPVLDAIIPKIPLGRGGAAHVYARGARQLYDGLTTSAGYTPAVSGVTSTGTLDNTMAIAKAGGGAVSVAFSKTQLANGLYKQVAAISGMNATTVMTLSAPGASGALLKDRIIPGRSYRLVMRVGMSGITGTIKGVNVFAVGTLTGHPGTGQRTLWAGRTQYGYVEGGSAVFPQADAEAARDYMSVDFSVPLGCTLADFAPAVVVVSGSASAGITIEIEDILLQDRSPD